MPPRNETVRDRSNYFRRRCKKTALLLAPSPPPTSPYCARSRPRTEPVPLSRGDVSLLLKPRSPRRYYGNVCAIFAFTTSQRRKIMKQQKKFSNHAMPARRPRKTQGKCVLFPAVLAKHKGNASSLPTPLSCISDTPKRSLRRRPPSSGCVSSRSSTTPPSPSATSRPSPLTSRPRPRETARRKNKIRAEQHALA